MAGSGTGESEQRDEPGEGPESRGRIVVLDENEFSRAFICGALGGALYDAVGVATPLGLRKALAPGRAVAVMCEVSPPLTYHQVVDTMQTVRAITEDRLPVVLSGTQSAPQLAILVRACRAAGFVERTTDPLSLVRGLQGLVTAPRGAMPAEHIRDLAPPAPAEWTLSRVLLIDDSEIVVTMIQSRLQSRGFDVRIALSLAEVQSIIRGWSPNVIIADVNMPDMRGDDLCARLKVVATTREAIVILLSSMPEEELKPLAEAAGADGFVSKTEGLDRCVSRIEALCGRVANPIVTFL